MEKLTLDADELDSVAEIIERYIKGQKEIINQYLSNIASLSAVWKDDQTFAPLYNEIVNLKRMVDSKMEEVSDYSIKFRIKADFIRIRPQYMAEESTASLSQSIPSQIEGAGTSSVSISFISSEHLDVKKLNAEMCVCENVGNRGDYVRVSRNPERIRDLDEYTFLSPLNGKPIEAKLIAWRSVKSVDESNSMNVCGAEFYYKGGDHAFCGSYIGESWEDIYNNNFSETEKYRQ